MTGPGIGARTDAGTGLTTRGRCLLAGGLATAACAVVLDERDLLQVGVFVALLPLLARILVAVVRRGVDADRVAEPARVPVGGRVDVAVRVRAPRLGALLGGIAVSDTVPDAAGPDRVSPPRFVLHRSAAGRSTTVRYPLVPTMRGAHRIGPLHTAVGDPLGLAVADRDLIGTRSLLVVPRVEPLTGLPTLVARGERAQGAALAHQGHGSTDVLVRPYRPGDELRRVHWRSTARHDELMVRLEERPWRGATTVLLDRRSGAHAGHGPGGSLEAAVSAVASICGHLRAAHEPFTLVAEDGTPLSSGGQDQDALLDQLAVLRPSARPGLSGPALAPGDGVIAVLGTVDDTDAAALLARHSGGGCAVLLDVPAYAQAHGAGAGRAGPDRGARGDSAGAAALRRAGWATAPLSPGGGLPAAWTRIVAGGAR